MQKYALKIVFSHLWASVPGIWLEGEDQRETVAFRELKQVILCSYFPKLYQPILVLAYLKFGLSFLHQQFLSTEED